MKTIKELLLEAAHSAGAILMKHYGNLQRIDTKARETDLVTIADRESEAFIINQIHAAFPHHNVLAEESGISAPQTSEFRWVIDPLDGTTNFAHTYPVFCVSIGVEQAGEMVLGAVYNPYYEEFFFAEKEKGAFLNDRPIHVSKTPSLAKSLILTGFYYDRRERAEHYLKPFRAFMERCHGIRRSGAAALDLCAIASGRADGFWEESLSPWDTAAGWLIIEEAGGRVTDFSGAPFAIEKKQIIATNALVHKQMLDVFAALES